MSKVNLNKRDLSSIVIDGEAELIFTEEMSKHAGRKFVMWGAPVLVSGCIAGWFGFLALGVAMFILYVLIGLYVVQTRCAKRFSKLFMSFLVPALLVIPVPFLENPPTYVVFPAWAIFMVCFVGLLNVTNKGMDYER